MEKLSRRSLFAAAAGATAIAAIPPSARGDLYRFEPLKPFATGGVIPNAPLALFGDGARETIVPLGYFEGFWTKDEIRTAEGLRPIFSIP